MPEDSLQEKTERATPRKRLKAREEGQVAKSIEIPSVFVLFVGVTLMFFYSKQFGNHIAELMRISLTFDAIPDFNIRYCVGLLEQMSVRLLRLMLPVMGALLLTGLILNFIQVSW